MINSVHVLSTKLNLKQSPKLSSMLGLKLNAGLVLVLLLAFHFPSHSETVDPWLKINDFESAAALQDWTIIDTQNETQPRIENPQVTEVRKEPLQHNQYQHYLIKKPAAEGVVGNRKALSFAPLPVPIEVGDTYTFYLRINVEYFPNNHVFGLSDMQPDDIIKNAYNAIEPSLRVTDRYDPNIDYKNDGTLLVRKNNWYSKIHHLQSGTPAKPMETDTWYEIWMVVNNQKKSEGGQGYDVYIRGGSEFPTQQKVFTHADFRMQRENPILYFLATCNTGPIKDPYGNGGLRYDDLYMVKGEVLSSPITNLTF